MSILTQFENFAINTDTAQSTEGGCYRRRRRRRYSGCYYTYNSCYNPCGTTTEEPKEVTPTEAPEPTPTPTPIPPVSEAPSSEPIGCLDPETCGIEAV